MPSVNSTRLRSSGTAKMFLTLSCSIKGDLGTRASLPQHLCLAAGGRDLLGGLAAELVRLDGQRLADVAARQHFHPHVALHQPALAEQLRRHLDVAVEALGERIEVHHLVFLTERIVESALGHAPVQRHLAALEPALLLPAGPRLRALVAARRRLAVARPVAAPDALLRVLGPLGRPQIAQTHDRLSLLDRHQVTDLENHPAHRVVVGQLHAVADATESQALDHRRLVLVEPDGAANLRDLHALRVAAGLLRSFRHGYAPVVTASAAGSSSLPRSRRTAAGSRSMPRPVNVARTTLCEFADPIDLVSTFWMPAASTTPRPAPPPIMPVPPASA